jgi:DNA segregation ATPase FtsK/SpoIIIE, S-DNA-T family
VFGDLALALPARLMGGYPTGLLAFLTAAAFFVPAAWLGLFGAGLLGRPESAQAPEKRRSRRKAAETVEEIEEDDFEDEDEEDDEGMPLIGAMAHWWLSSRAFLRRRLGGRQILPGIDPWG